MTWEKVCRGDPLTRSRRSLLAGLGAAAVGISLDSCAAKAPVGANGEERRLNLYNWDNYIGDTTIADFKAATGVAVKTSLFSTNDELFAKLRPGNPGFDVIVPSNEYVTRLRIAGLIQPLDHAKLPNLTNIQAAFLNPPFDPGRRWSMPYTWLVQGLGYRKSKIDGVPDSWKWVMASDRYKGRIGLVSEADDLIELGAKYLGYSVRHIPATVIERVAQMYIRQKPNIKVFPPRRWPGPAAGRRYRHCHRLQWRHRPGDAGGRRPGFRRAARRDRCSTPDCLCIPTGAPRPDNAHRFINFVLDGKNGAGIAAVTRYPTPNAAARALTPAAYRRSPVVFPPAAALAKCEYGDFEGLERAHLFDETVTRILAAW